MVNDRRGSPCTLFVVVPETSSSWHATQTFAREIEILGHRITQEGRTPLSKGVEAILSMPTPTNISAVKRFLGLCGYFRDFIPCMSTRTHALRSLLKKSISFQWTEETERQFQDLKQAITGPDVMLFHPD